MRFFEELVVAYFFWATLYTKRCTQISVSGISTDTPTQTHFSPRGLP